MMGESSKNRKTKVGVVVSNTMDKSVVVNTERTVKHDFYGKIMRRNVKYMAHDPENTCAIGDRVMIEECRPLSKRKRWQVKSIIEKAV